MVRDSSLIMLYKRMMVPIQKVKEVSNVKSGKFEGAIFVKGESYSVWILLAM